MNKEGFTTILGLLFFAFFLGLVGYIYSNTLILIICAVNIILVGVAVYFFRDPLRVTPENPNAVISPADGRVIDISEVMDSVFFENRVTRMTIYMSLIDVHVNYIPYDGIVEYLKYSRGEYHRANLSTASQKNVHSYIGLETKYGKIAFKQITGAVARRIVCNLKLGQKVKAGQKFGMIKFGSRMEIFLPPQAKIIVKLGERLRAGESVIAVFNGTR
ncbi:phosphatidylserine decarboxylase family protein [candidate division KSB1 bacterium]|nr:phosphatidylserine decarboxylase family protein [candidate division KSB1 bacterium]